MADQDAPKLRYNCYLLREHLPTIEHALRAKYRPGGREEMTKLMPTSAAPAGAVAYLGTTEARTPKWAENLEPMFSGVAALTNQAHRVVVFLPVRTRHFAVCFGYGSAALEWDALETNFGLRVAARRFKPNRISELRSRKIDVTARTQSSTVPVGGELRDLGVDLEGEFVRKLVGELAGDGVDDTPSGAVMAGDSIAFRATTDLAKVQEQLSAMLDDLAQAAQADFSFIDALEPLRNKQAVVGKLEDLLGAAVLQKMPKGNDLAGLDQHCLEFAPPDEVRMDEVEDFVITYRDKEHVFDNASLPGIRTALTTVGVKRGHTYLRQARIIARSADGSPASQALPLIQWLVFEVGSSTERFVLTLGRWFKLSEDYAKKLNGDLKKIKDVTADLGLPTWDTSAGDEGKYNEKAAAADSNLVLMDKVKVTPSEGGNVEACDLLQKDGSLIHVKRYNKSQTLSHLFSQAYVSVELLRTDDAYKHDFVTKVTDRDGEFAKVAMDAPRRVTFAIGLADDRDLPLDLPIFSKVNLRDHAKRIKVAGVEPTLARIEMI